MSEREKLKISTRVMYDELLRQSATVRILDAASSLLEYHDTSGRSHLLFSTASDKSSSAGTLIARNKKRGKLIAQNLNIPVPADVVCSTLIDVLDFFACHDQVVLKPLDNSGGTGVSTHIKDRKTLEVAYDYARESGPDVIAQQHVDGVDIRLLVIGGTFRSAVERRPATITGDGESTIHELIIKENASPARTDNYMTLLSHINVKSANRFLTDDISSIPPKGTVVTVIGPANLSLGGSAHEATHKVSPAMVADAEKMARRLGLGICGVDMMWDPKTDRHYFIEVNATPGIDMHDEPFWGTSTDAIKQYVKWLVDPLQQMPV